MKSEFTNLTTRARRRLDESAVGGREIDVSAEDATMGDRPTRSIWVGGGGDLKVQLITGTTITLTNVAEGSMLPISCKQILSSGTTASGLVALF